MTTETEEEEDQSKSYFIQESCAIAKMTARCALYK